MAWPRTSNTGSMAFLLEQWRSSRVYCHRDWVYSYLGCLFSSVFREAPAPARGLCASHFTELCVQWLFLKNSNTYNCIGEKPPPAAYNIIPAVFHCFITNMQLRVLGILKMNNARGWAGQFSVPPSQCLSLSGVDLLTLVQFMLRLFMHVW